MRDMPQNPISELSDSSMKNLQSLIDSNTVIGKAVDAGGGVTILPVCKVSFGFVTGGSEYPKSQKEAFGGGNGGGVTIVPIAFLVIKNGDVSLLQVQSFSNTSDRVVGMVPEVMDKISGLVAGLKKNTASGDKAEDSPAAPDDGMDPAGK